LVSLSRKESEKKFNYSRIGRKKIFFLVDLLEMSKITLQSRCHTYKKNVCDNIIGTLMDQKKTI